MHIQSDYEIARDSRLRREIELNERSREIHAIKRNEQIVDGTNEEERRGYIHHQRLQSIQII